MVGRGLLAVRADCRLIGPSYPTEEVCGSVADVPPTATLGKELPSVARLHTATVLVVVELERRTRRTGEPDTPGG